MGVLIVTRTPSLMSRLITSLGVADIFSASSLGVIPSPTLNTFGTGGAGGGASTGIGRGVAGAAGLARSTTTGAGSLGGANSAVAADSTAPRPGAWAAATAGRG